MPTRIIGNVEQEIKVKDGLVKIVGDLSIAIDSFRFEIEGEHHIFDGVNKESLNDDATNYIYISDAGELEISTNGWPETAYISLARVITSNGLITHLFDERRFLTGCLNKSVEYGSEENLSQTTSTISQQKLRLTTNDLEAGTYIVNWYAEVRHSNDSVSEHVEIRCQINDSLEIGFGMWPLNSWDDWGGFRVFDTTGGVQNIDIDYRVQGGGTAYCRRARISIWRLK